jgi:hypothetical protein
MEEQQIQDFVHRVANDEAMQRALRSDPVSVVRREGFSERVERVILRLVPQLAFAQTMGPSEKWWHA